jgi:hypothetical protein
MPRNSDKSRATDQAALEKAINDLLRLRPKALETLEEALSAPSRRIRLRAARIILKHAPQLRKEAELRATVAQLEEAAHRVLTTGAPADRPATGG